MAVAQMSLSKLEPERFEGAHWTSRITVGRGPEKGQSDREVGNHSNPLFYCISNLQIPELVSAQGILILVLDATIKIDGLAISSGCSGTVGKG